MSSRALKKALRERELAEAAKREEELAAAASKQNQDDDADEDEESEDDDVVKTARANLFDLLGGEDNDDDDDEDEPKPETEDEEEEEVRVVQTKSQKKKNKKKKKKGKKPAAKEEPEADAVDEIEAALRELNAKERKRGNAADIDRVETPVAAASSQDFGVLKLDTKHLDVTHELRRLFGRAAVEDRAEVQDPIVMRGGRRVIMRGGGRSAASASSRRNFLVQPKASWPPVGSGGLGMELVSRNDADGTSKYTFVHSGGYSQLQQEFFGFVLTMDHEQIRRMLQINPFHSSCLLMVAYMLAHEGDNATSGDFVERALYNFGRTASVQFTKLLTEGKGRLDFNRFESREFYLAVWKYIHNLGLRGTWRTAEEYGWLLFSLDPEDDPYQAILMLDFLMLKAKSYDRLLSFAQSPAYSSRFSQLPNYAYSTALAQLLLGNRALAEEQLRKAITKFPWVVSRMFSALNVDDELPEALWGVLPPDDMKAQAVYSELYVERTKDIWKLPEAQQFFVDIALTVHNLPRVKLLKHQELPSHEKSVDGIPLSLARHVYLYDNKTILMSLPAEYSRAPTMDFDPFPPALEYSPYSEFLLSVGTENQQQQHPFAVGGEGRAPMEVINSLLERMPGMNTETVTNMLRQFGIIGPDGDEQDGEEAQEGVIPGAFPTDDQIPASPNVAVSATAPARPEAPNQARIQSIFRPSAPAPPPLPEKDINYYLHHEIAYRTNLYSTQSTFPPRDQTVHLITFLLDPFLRSNAEKLKSAPGDFAWVTSNRSQTLKHLLSLSDINIHTLLRELEIHAVLAKPNNPDSPYRLTKEYLESLRDVPDSEYPPNYYDPTPAISRFRRSFVENYPAGSEIQQQELNNLTRTLLGACPLPGGREVSKVETYVNWVLGVSSGWDGLDKERIKKRRLDIASKLEKWADSENWWRRELPVNPLQAMVEDADDEEYFSDEQYFG
ncbi:DUF654-domain-containing protein [Ascobolus immersus RN42]|uniref:DUF654-domain-containing protein n=1 Tax=Ascobolus immersus RN42 TaxID=1160509 RepID=A0A3N4I5R0_ASCIM|nr:DUF654-domain-containing protein [Ascobolus immersus RN42]